MTYARTSGEAPTSASTSSGISVPQYSARSSERVSRRSDSRRLHANTTTVALRLGRAWNSGSEQMTRTCSGGVGSGSRSGNSSSKEVKCTTCCDRAAVTSSSSRLSASTASRPSKHRRCMRMGRRCAPPWVAMVVRAPSLRLAVRLLYYSRKRGYKSTPSSVTAPFVLRVTAFGGGLCYVLQLLAGGCVTCYSRPEQPIKGARTLKYQTQSVFSSPPAGSGTHSKESHSERFFFFSFCV